MKPIDATNEKFMPVSLFGKFTLFHNLRLDRATIPEGLHAYDIRHADEDWMDAAGIKPFVMVNHMGTIVTKEEFEFPMFGDLPSDIKIDDDEFVFLAENDMTMQEYINGDFDIETDTSQHDGMTL